MGLKCDICRRLVENGIEVRFAEHRRRWRYVCDPCAKAIWSVMLQLTDLHLIPQ